MTFADGYNESLPVFIYTGKYFRSLFSSIFHNHAIPLYDFTIGFGEDIAGALSWEGFGDPFTLNSIFVPTKYAAYGFSLMAVLKYYAAGLTFLYCCRKSDIHGMAAVSSALAYALCGFGLYYGGIFYTFTSALIYFPLYVLGVKNIVGQRSHTPFRAFSLLSVSVFLLSLSGFYYLYMDTVMGVIYFLVLFTQRRKETDRKSIFVLIIQVIVQYLIGMFMAAGILLPTIYEYLLSKRQGCLQEILSYLTGLPTVSSLKQTLSLLVMPDFEDGLGLCILTMIALVLLFMQRGKYRTIKLMTGILLVGLVLPGFGSVMNGFSYTVGRWQYMLYFAAIFWMARLLQDRDTLTKTERIAAWISVILCLIFYVLFHRQDAREDRTAILLHLTVYGVIALLTLILLCRPKIPKRALEWILVANVVASSFWFYTDRSGGYRFVGNFRGDAVKDVTGSTTAAIAWEDDSDDFSRVDIYDASLASSLILDVPTASTYYSMSNGSIYEFFTHAGISSGIRGSYFCLRGLDGRRTAESLLSVRAYCKDDQASEIVRVEKEDRLPMGIPFDNVVSETEASSMDPLTVSASLLDTLIIDDDSVHGGDIPKDRYEELSFSASENGISWDSDTEKLITQAGAQYTGTVDVAGLDPEREYEYYLLLSDFHYLDPVTETNIDINGRTIQLKGTTVSYHVDSDDYLVLINTYTENPIFTITFPDAGTFSLGDVQVLAVDVTDLGEQIQERQDGAMSDAVIGINKVSGHIDSDADSWYFFSIPWCSAWKCKIDGVETETVRADYGFTAIRVPAGDHDIVFSYHPAYEFPMIIALAGGWGVCIFSLIRRRRERKEPVHA
ncbi:YfhO family protein [Blautia massiliensis (ex Durand et al. 2017)]|uniref:YfhO family protein n=1 Tax=Blautia massiliensis (ex Durand et al. 2017) TaxID=1737424 RepID=UPI00242CF927|nr:YfhO family protein [Blautia massiliensis (ex Durand et al. 2017)]